MEIIHHYLLKDHLVYPHLPFHIQTARHNHDFHTHRHDFTELTLVLEGKGYHLVSGHTYPIGGGDLFVVHPGLYHGFIRPENLKMINIMFSWKNPLIDLQLIGGLPGFHQLFTLDPMLRDSGIFKRGLNLSGENRNYISGLVYNLLGEYTLGDEGFEGMISSYYQQLIITLSRGRVSQHAELPAETGPLAWAMAYMQENYQNHISADELARAACVSSRHLSRLFNNLLDLTPFEYLSDLRLREAHRQLMSRDATITEIAENCGFSDSNYFSQVFKKRYKQSPRDYRKGVRNGE